MTGAGLPAEAIAQIAEDTRNAGAGQFGVRQIELYHSPDGKVYCVLEGPDEEAVRKHHTALGVPCGDVRHVNSITGRSYVSWHGGAPGRPCQARRSKSNAALNR
jgi:hypothetical protein